jgi:hypothetical protein
MSFRIRGFWPVVSLATLGVIAALAVDLDVVKSLIGSSALRVGIKALALSFSAGSGVYSFIRSERRHHESSIKQERREALVELERTLVSSIQNLFVGEPREIIRANVMVVSGEELGMLASVNMQVFPDYRLRLHKGQGCAGVAWEQAVDGPIDDCWKPVYAAKAQLTPSSLKGRWKLTDEQIRKTKNILWILSIPLFEKTESRRTFLGVLNYDGVHRMLEQPGRLSQPDFIGSCVVVGERVAEVAAAQRSLMHAKVDTRLGGQ